MDRAEAIIAGLKAAHRAPMTLQEINELKQTAAEKVETMTWYHKPMEDAYMKHREHPQVPPPDNKPQEMEECTVVIDWGNSELNEDEEQIWSGGHSFMYLRDLIALKSAISALTQWKTIYEQLKDGTIITRATYNRMAAIADLAHQEMIDILCSGMEQWQLKHGKVEYRNTQVGAIFGKVVRPRNTGMSDGARHVTLQSADVTIDLIDSESL